MFKHGWKLIGLLFVAVFIFLWLIKAPIMSTYLTNQLGIAVTVRTISMWPKETTIRHFRIENPHSYRTRTAFEADKIKIAYRWGALTGRPSEIDLIALDNVFLNIYINNVSGSDNNWAAIGSQIPERKGGREVIVHKLILTKMTVKTEGPGAKLLGVSGTQYFDQMEFDEIDSREGFPTKELISRIFQGAGLKKYLEKFLNPTERIKEALSPFKIFGKSPQGDPPRARD